MKYVITGFLWVVLLSGVCRAAGEIELKNETDKINYSVGYQIGSDLKKEGVELNPDAMLQGIRDALAKNKTLMTHEEMRTTIINLKKSVISNQKEQSRQTVETYRGEGREFLAENAKVKGVISLASGVQYKILREGTGRNPTPGDTVTVNYRSTLIDGTEFDSTYHGGKPRAFLLNNVIPGLREALLLMKEGAKWQIFIPADLAFGERGSLAERVVIYELELVSVLPAK